MKKKLIKENSKVNNKNTLINDYPNEKVLYLSGLPSLQIYLNNNKFIICYKKVFSFNKNCTSKHNLFFCFNSNKRIGRIAIFIEKIVKTNHDH